jgi:hypothetical protein
MNKIAEMSFGNVVETLGLGVRNLNTEYFMGNTMKSYPGSRFWEPNGAFEKEGAWTLYERSVGGPWTPILEGPGTKREGVWTPDQAACLARHMHWKCYGHLGEWLESRQKRREAANPELFGVW